MKIAIGADHAGYRLKEHLKQALSGHQIIDVGTRSTESCDYPVYAQEVCRKIASGEAERGILICGTGIGMSIAGNRLEGVRTALCHNEFTAERARLHNNAQILAMGSEVVNLDMAVKMVHIFLQAVFDRDDPQQARHVRRLEMIDRTIVNHP